MIGKAFVDARGTRYLRMPSFPSYRPPRRLRRTDALRRMVRERNSRRSSSSCRSSCGRDAECGSRWARCRGVPDVVDEMLRDAREAERLGIGGVLLFGIRT